MHVRQWITVALLAVSIPGTAQAQLKVVTSTTDLYDIAEAVGGDKIKARFMRADFFEFDPTHKLQMLTNHKPIIKGSDNGFLEPVDLNLGFGFRFCLNRTVLGTRHVAPE